MILLPMFISFVNVFYLYCEYPKRENRLQMFPITTYSDAYVTITLVLTYASLQQLTSLPTISFLTHFCS